MLRVPDKSTERLLALAAYFETLDPALYNQRRYKADDGAMCICGHANTRAGYQADDHVRACSLLGIPGDVGHKLFAGGAGRTYHLFTGKYTDPTPKDAARVLRHLAVTGELPEGWNCATINEEVIAVAEEEVSCAFRY